MSSGELGGFMVSSESVKCHTDSFSTARRGARYAAAEQHEAREGR